MGVECLDVLCNIVCFGIHAGDGGINVGDIWYWWWVCHGEGGRVVFK